MTEAEWDACADPTPMLAFLRARASDRKLRLFACACCRRIWRLLTDARSQRAVELAEHLADEPLGADQLKTTDMNAGEAVQNGCDSAADAAHLTLSDPLKAALYGYIGASCAVRLPAWRGRDYASAVREFASMTPDERHLALWTAEAKGARIAELEIQATLLRDLFANPFRRFSLDPSWQTPNVLALTKAAYNDRIIPAGILAPARLAELAGALEAAGCRHAEVIGHLRSPLPHWRGCWAVDVILGKE